MHIFYIPDIKGYEAELPEKESGHAIKVLRMNVGSRVNIVDGKGGLYYAEITEANPRRCRLKILNYQKELREKNYRLHIAIAPTKNIDRFEWFLEKATEIGIDEITPLLTSHSERKIIKPVRLQKILIAAMKQSQKANLPELNTLTAFNDFIKENNIKQKFIAHCNKGHKPHLKDMIQKGSDVLILIGPEGDFSDEEIKNSLQAGFKEITLGNSRLRTETAGVAACLIANIVNYT
jgi:16S rRNA (uracil1498-N3)-methyltransferase